MGRLEKIRVRLRWPEGRATASAIVAARKLIPALADVPLSRLLEAAQGSAEYDLGEYAESTAIELQERAKQHGLVVLLEAG